MQSEDERRIVKTYKEENEENQKLNIKNTNLREQSPYETQMINRLFYNYMGHAFTLSNNRHQQNLELNENEIYILPNSFDIKSIVDRFMISFKKKGSLIKALLTIFGCDGLLTIVLILINTICSIITPLILNLIIKYIAEKSTEFSDDGKSETYGYFLSFLLCSILIFKVLIGSLALEKEKFLQVKTQTAIYGSIYSKMIKISKKAISKSKFGNIIALISSDSQVVIECPNMLNVIISSPASIILTLITMYIQLSWYSLLGVGITALIILCQQSGMKFLFYYWHKMISFSDKRIQFLTEVLDGIKLIKLYSWEKFAFRKTRSIREEEQSFLLKALISKSAFEIGVNLASVLMFGVVFGIYSTCEGSLSLSQIFITITLFNLLQPQINKLIQFQNSIQNFFLSVKRIESFLNLDEHIQNASNDIELGAILIQNASFTFGKEGKYKLNEDIEAIKSNSLKLDKLMNEGTQKSNSQKNNNSSQKNVNQTNSEIQNNEKSRNISVELINKIHDFSNKDENILNSNDLLTNVNIKFEKGNFYAIVGMVGSGKTSFLYLIIDELNLESGKISINGKISFVSQIPWIINDTLKNNILMNEIYDRNKYQEIIKLCELEEDLTQLPQGDNTQIGSKGINLSGGQKQRICIARALYKNSDIYLIDDCLSSSDSKVGQKIFENALIKKLNGKTIILVTHGIDYLKNVKNIIYLNKGKIEYINNYEGLYKHCQEFRKNNFQFSSEYQQITLNTNINNLSQNWKNFHYSSSNISESPTYKNKSTSNSNILSKYFDSVDKKENRVNFSGYFLFFKLGGKLI